MELDTIKSGIDRMMGTFLRGGEFDVHWACEILSAARKYIDEPPGADDPPVSADDDFAILSMPRYEALREAEENLQKMRFEPTDDDEDEKQATIDALTRRLDGVCNESNARLKEIERLVALVRNLHGSCDEYQSRTHALQEEIGRLKGAAKEEIRHLREAAKVRADEVFLKHVQDLQSEVDGIKDRLDAQDRAVGEKFGTIFDRLGAFAGRMNQLKAREAATP
jgi:chromosome segregation ATPase